ncbi:MAG: ATP-dependent DNA helicase RecG, partial [Rhodospirillales bacterium]|nr:ATP-dependent DNA helicase RecG [Rhodospirillales bacterium]
MRPEILYTLFRSVTALRGVGPRIGALIERRTGPSLVHLLWHLPSGLIDRRHAPKITEALASMVATITVRVDQHRKPPNKRMPYKVLCSDETGSLSLVFFHAHEDYLRKILPEGETRVVSGQIEVFGDEIQMSHPDHVVQEADIASIMTIEPLYPLTTGLTMKVLSRAIDDALKDVPELPEWADAAYVTKQNWPSWRDA